MNEPVNNTEPSDDKVHLLDHLIILAKHSRMIILASAAVAILTYLILFIQPNKYTSTARLLPPQQNLTLSAQLLDRLGARVSPGDNIGGGVSGGLASSLLSFSHSGEMYVAMMTSETVLDPIIARFHLKELYKTRYHEDTRMALLKNTRIIFGRKDSIIVIDVNSTNPKLAAEMANAFIEGLDRLLKGLVRKEANERLTFLEKERLQTSQNLTKAEESVRFFSEKNSVLQIDTQTKGAIDYVAKLRAEIDAREVLLHVLRQQATSFNYDVVRLETGINGLKEKLRNAESRLENSASDICLPTSKAPGLGLEYLRLLREAKFQESLYQLFSSLVEMARIDIMRDVMLVQVLSPATLPEKRANKRLIPSLLAGMLTSFFMIFVVLLREGLHNLNADNIQRLSVLQGYLASWRDIRGRFCGRYSRDGH
jgi:tyrosine-protein kinase Etk/Wzc